MSKIEETLKIAEELYEYGIINKNNYVKDRAMYLIRNLAVVSELENSLDNNRVDYSAEIAKVKRKVPKWMNKQNQYNYRILKAYMDLSKCNEKAIDVEAIQEYSEIEPKIFLGHYNGMKTISKKNHGKVFEESNKMVELWKPVAEFIEKIFEDNSIETSSKNQYIEKQFRHYVLQSVEYETTVDGYVKSLNEDFPSKLNIDSIFNIVNIDFLQKIYDRCSTNGDLHDWSYSIGHGRPMAAIKNYILFVEAKK